MIGCNCPVCLSEDPRDKRFRSSVWLEADGFSCLIDTTPDLRLQAMRAGMNRLDAVVCTHSHNDHLIGFDDLRRFCVGRNEPLPVHCSPHTYQRLLTVFPYAFKENSFSRGYVRAKAQVFEEAFDLGPLHLIPVPVPHGNTPTHGFIIEKEGKRLAAYIPDCAKVTEAVASQLQNLPILILDGLRDKPHPTHLSVSEAIEAGQRVKAGKIYLTHLTHDICHARRQCELPENVFLAYDGLVLDLI
jgi:phosphoribosyl 1,2-cyclic phosphate phosphodiesterase